MANCHHFAELGSKIDKTRCETTTIDPFCQICERQVSEQFLCLDCSADSCPKFYCKEHMKSHHHKLYYNMSNSRYMCFECGEVANAVTDEKITSLVISIDSFRMRSLVGLVNVGNTCFMNVILQWLSQCPPISYFFRKISPHMIYPKTNDSIILKRFSDLMKELWNSEQPVNPSLFTNSFYSFKSWFEPKTQQDSFEFLRILLDILENGLSGRSSIIKDTFCSVLSKELTCLSCGHCHKNEEMTYNFSLPIREAKREYIEAHPWIYSFTSFMGISEKSELGLKEVLDHYFEDEDIELFTCESCEWQTSGVLRTKMTETPNVLVIALKRFLYTSSGAVKLDTKINLPTTLDLSEYSEDGNIYQLNCVIEHIGTIRRGHYRAFIKHPVLNIWIEFNDKKIRYVTNDIVKNVQAYIVMYSKVHEKLCEEGRSIVPLEWTIKYNYFRNCGRISFENIACEHNNVSLFVDPECLTTISEQLFSRFSDSSINSSSHCEECIALLKQLTDEIEIQKKSFCCNAQDDDGYVVSHDWWKTWKKFINWKGLEKGFPLRPQEVMNLYIIEEIEEHGRILSEHIVLPEDSWETILKFYKADYQIRKLTYEYEIKQLV